MAFISQINNESLLLSFSDVMCRKVWSCVCIHTFPHICRALLHSLWPCGYVTSLSEIPIPLNSSSFINNYAFCFLVCSAAVGISFLQFTNMNSMRNLIIVGLTLFLGISVPQFFNEYWNPSHHGLVHTNAGWVSFL